ncbi:MAG: PD-(D/E)XK nuclease family protein, partial [Nanoarchaeota archaeon]|nr:PD-(D/E)XK nuclease family protein [Nanoarchaeota archaeon]
IMNIAKHLKDCGVEFSTTFFSASDEAMRNIITFLKGIISSDFNEVKNAMFTPFFPESLQRAFEIADDPVFDKIKDPRQKLEELYKRCPAFYKLRQTVKNVEDVNQLFLERIMPIAIAYGKEYVFAVAAIQNSYQEALKVIEDKTKDNLIAYLESSDFLADESDTKRQITLTTVHKAKGREFDIVIYAPTITRDKSNFQDDVVKAILKTKGINAEEELEEETLRVNFVAFTRAKKKLYVLTDKPMDYYNEYSVKDTFEVADADAYAFSEGKKRAYNLFVNGKFEEAKDLLTTKKAWLRDFVKDYFRTIDSISFTSISDDAYDYFTNKILDIHEFSSAMGLGSEVHRIAEKICKKEGYGVVPDKIKPFEENIKKLVQEIETNYPERVDVENRFSIPLSKLLGTAETLNFTGMIDAIFKNGGKYMIVDWKTDKNIKRGSKHRQQLEVYRRAYSILEGVPLDDIRVAIGFVGLRPTINTGHITSKLDMLQPQAKSFETFSKKVHNLLSWKNNVDTFFENLIEQKKYADEVLWRSIVEQYDKEKK